MSLGAHLIKIAPGDQDPDIFYENVLRAFRCLLARPRWSRIWTVQKCVLPFHATIICGPFTFNWRAMLQASLLFESHAASCCKPYITRSNPRNQAVIREIRQLFAQLAELGALRDKQLLSLPRSNPANLLKVLYRFTSRNATDDRDKIYGLLSLLGGPNPYPVVADYTKSITHLYEDITWKIISDLRSFRILHDNVFKVKVAHFKSSSQIQRNVPSLATWAMDWGRSLPKLKRFSLIDFRNRLQPPATYSRTARGGVLGVPAWHILTVDWVSELHLGSRSDIMRFWKKAALPMSTPCPSLSKLVLDGSHTCLRVALPHLKNIITTDSQKQNIWAGKTLRYLLLGLKTTNQTFGRTC
jgi:hypothetical protein